MPSGARLEGADKMRRTLQRVIKTAPREFGMALRAEVNIETKECQRRTPVDTGALKQSIRSFGPEYAGSFIKAGTTAGGPGVSYAWRVHEDLEAYHRVGQAKFIESTYRESSPYIMDRIARRVDVARLVR